MSKNKAIFCLFFSTFLFLSNVKVSLPRDILFSGYTWNVVSQGTLRGPGPNIFDSRNVMLDRDDRMILEIRKRGTVWSSAHVFLRESLGYGTYKLVLAPIQRSFDPLTVFGFFTWDDNPEYANREIDIEIARWGIPRAPNLNLTVQPAEDRPERSGLKEFNFSSATTLEFLWKPDKVEYKVYSDIDFFSWSFPEPESNPQPFGVPPVGNAWVGINLWLFQGREPTHGDRVIIESFNFQPWVDE